MEQVERLVASLSDDGRYRLLIEAVTDYAIYMLDADGIVTSWNPGARRFKGYEAAEIIGTHFSKFYTEEDRRSGLPARALEIAAREGKFENEEKKENFHRIERSYGSFVRTFTVPPWAVPPGTLAAAKTVTFELAANAA